MTSLGSGLPRQGLKQAVGVINKLGRVFNGLGCVIKLVRLADRTNGPISFRPQRLIEV